MDCFAKVARLTQRLGDAVGEALAGPAAAEDRSLRAAVRVLRSPVPRLLERIVILSPTSPGAAMLFESIPEWSNIDILAEWQKQRALIDMEIFRREKELGTKAQEGY